MKKTTSIAFATIIILALGYIGLFYWSQNQFLKARQDAVKMLEAKGFTIEDNPPITFSMAPFKLIAYQDNFKATRRTNKGYSEITSIEATISTSFFNPLKWDIKSTLRLEGLLNPSMLPYTKNKMTKKALVTEVGFRTNEKDRLINVAIETSHLSLKLRHAGDTVHLKSVKIHDFKATWEDPRINSVNFSATGQVGKYSIKSHGETNFTHKFKFHALNIQKLNVKTKQSASISIPQWTGKIKFEGSNLLKLLGELIHRAEDFEDKDPNGDWCAFFNSLLTEKLQSLEDVEKAKETIKVESKIIQDTNELGFNVLLQIKNKRPALTISIDANKGEQIATAFSKFIAESLSIVSFQAEDHAIPTLLLGKDPSYQENIEFDLASLFSNTSCKKD